MLGILEALLGQNFRWGPMVDIRTDGWLTLPAQGMYTLYITPNRYATEQIWGEGVISMKQLIRKRRKIHIRQVGWIALALALCLGVEGASACTAIYVGAERSADGSAFVARSEDFGPGFNKLFMVVPAGVHQAGEAYQGCYGFTWTFTHDSYGYTAFSDDNGPGVGGVCPNCHSDHPHTPFQSAGTNDQGLTVTATESLFTSDEVEAADPYREGGIEEAEMATILLSEAGTAREALALLTTIYDTVGACHGSGVFLADAHEIWYIENVTGHEYIALRLPENLILIQPNLSIIGLIDLDDRDNVVASPRLMEVARENGFFVGDAAAGQIDYCASYNGDQSADDRLTAGLAYLNPACAPDAMEVPDSALYMLTNVDEDGQIVPLHNGIQVENPVTIAQVQQFYRIPGIGNPGNMETHIFQLKGAHVVEWVAMNNAQISPFIPYIPAQTKMVHPAYQVSTPAAAFTEEAPTEGLYYPATIYREVRGRQVEVQGYKVLPTNWADSMYWSYDALTSLMIQDHLSDAQKAHVQSAVDALQAQINAAFTALLPGTDMTAWSLAQADAAHHLAVEMVRGGL